jgi:imidazole glycerol-phosphate synthase subunit HisH
MNTPDVAVIDYGVGNLLSVCRGLERCGATVVATPDPSVILSAPRVVLPGVGAFADGMAGLQRHGLDDVVREVAARGTPLLGICLGMQMLLDESEEFGVTAGLGLIPGTVVPVPSATADGQALKIPHIGWNGLRLPDGQRQWGSRLFDDVTPGHEVYFVHSFMARPADPAWQLADCVYGGRRVTAAIARDRVFGCQFHPEKSGAVGLGVLRRFLTL